MESIILLIVCAVCFVAAFVGWHQVHLERIQKQWWQEKHQKLHEEFQLWENLRRPDDKELQ